MFYEQDKVNELVLCPYCKNKYNDPRIVKCSSSFCMSCIQLFANNDKNGFKCPVCNDLHKITRKECIKNSNLAKLCDMQANEVSRGSLADTLNFQINDIKLNLDEFSNKNSLRVEKRKENRCNLRNEVKIRSRELVESMKNLSLF